jgi:hypothetical protein
MVPIRQTSRKRIRESLLPESTPVPNRLFAILHLLTPSEVLVFLFIWRKTVGWQKSSDYISLSQIQKATGVGRRQALAASKLFANAGFYKRSRDGARGMALIELDIEGIGDAFERLFALVSERNQCQKETSTGVAESIVPVPVRTLTGVKETHTEKNSIQSNSLESKGRKDAASATSDFRNPKTSEAPTVRTIAEMQEIYRKRWHRGFPVSAKARPELEELVLSRGGEVVLQAFRLFIADKSDEFLLENRHPVSSFLKRIEAYILDKPAESDVPTEPVVEHEGKIIPVWLRDAKVKDAAELAARKRLREEQEQAGLRLAQLAENTPL